MRAKLVSIDTGCHAARARAQRDELVRDHLALVVSIARGVGRQLPPSFDLDDLIAVGNMALVRAAALYRPRRHGGCPFPAFARQRIRGAILDSVRRRNWTENTRPGLEVFTMNGGYAVNPADRAPIACPGIDQAIDLRRRAARVAEAMSWLPAAQQRILEEYYSTWQPTLTQVAQRLGLSRAQVEHQHRAALAALRARLRSAA